MENKRRSDGIWAFLLAAILSFGGIGCITTGFRLENVDLTILLLCCLGFSLVWVVACHYRFGIPIAAAALELFWMLPKVRTLMDSEKVLLYEISSAYHSGYGWPFLQWDGTPPTGSANYALGLIACVVSLVIVWTVIRRKKATLAAVAAFLPMMTCLVLTDTVPDSEYLMLMLGGLLMLALTNPLRRMDARQANRATAMLLVPVILITTGLFWIAPRDNYTPNQSTFDRFNQWLQEIPLWQQLTGNTPVGTVGDPGADKVSLDTLGDKSKSGRTALYVTAAANGHLYLRGCGYDTYDGQSWTASEYSSGVDSGWGTAYPVTTRVTVRMDYARNFYYFSGTVGPQQEKIPFEFGKIPNKDGEKTYTFLWGASVTGGSLSRSVREQCLQLPYETEQWAKEVLQQIDINLSASILGKANRIAKSVRDCAYYDLNPEKMPTDEQDFAKWFYTEAESGYCVHFATTATVLLRAAGIPARYVTGYTINVFGGEEIPVPENKAHAWVEFFDPNSGWTTLDPTPGFGDITNPTEPTIPTEPTEPTDATTLPTQPVSGPTQPPTEPTMPTDPTALQPTLPGRPSPGAQDSAVAEWVITVLLWILLAATVIWGQYRLRIQIRKWYMHRGEANQQALARWKSVRIRNCIFRQKPPIQLYVLAEKAKFSQHTLTEEELNAFLLHMAALAAKLRKKPWLIRWLLRLLWAIE